MNKNYKIKYIVCEKNGIHTNEYEFKTESLKIAFQCIADLATRYNGIEIKTLEVKEATAW